MGLFIGDSEPSKVYIGDTEASEIYVGDEKVRPNLLTYEQIVAMATTEGSPYTNTLSELNSKATDYYNLLYNGGHVSTDDSAQCTMNLGEGLLDSNGEFIGKNRNVICYIDSSNGWQLGTCLC